MNNLISFLGKKDLYYGIARYVLSGGMLGFGAMKIMGMQFNTIAGPASSYQQPLEYLTGVQLTWAFLGYSTWFQVLLGIFEFVPASLLLFRRTAFIGAVTLLPMTVSVFLINFGLHLWDSTRLQSLVLLLLNLSIFMFEWKKVKQILGIAHGPKIKFRYILPEVIVALIFILLPVIRKARADYGKSYQNVLTGDWYHRHPNEYTLISEKINDSALPHHELKVFFGSWEEYSEINDSVNNWDGYKRYTINEQAHLLHISADRNRISKMRGHGYYYLTGDFQYAITGDTLLLRQKINDSADRTWTFKKRVMHPNTDY